MKVCVLQPDYSTSAVDYRHYDPPRNLQALLPEHTVDHVFINKLHTYRQLRELSHKGYDIFVNLCEGYLEWDIPSIDAIYSLELLNLPFTGPGSALYDPPKELMKYLAYTCGVKSPAYAVVRRDDDAHAAVSALKYPLFIKPSKAGDSLGIDEHALVHSGDELSRQASVLFHDFDELIVEEYIDGREFTVLVAADVHAQKKCHVYAPVEYNFPKGTAYKTYALKTSALHPEANIPCTDEHISTRLKAASEAIFNGFGGVGYARLDFRLNAADEIYFLEINFTSSVFYEGEYEGSADFILTHDPEGKRGFLLRVIEEGMERHRRKQKPYVLKGNASSGYGIYATRNLNAGDIIYKGEERPLRIVTRRHVETHWSEADKLTFRQYAYPLSDEVYVLWDENPAEWAPQNHSCAPNTRYEGLNVVALQNITKGEELTLDYATFLDETMEPFLCSCKSANCRGYILASQTQSVTLSEKKLMKRETSG